MRNSNLSIDNALHGIADLVRDRIGPAVNDPFAAQMARLSCILLRICANGLDDAAELRFEENAAIRSILKEASIILNGPLSRQLDVAGASTDPGLKISVLDEGNHQLRLLLVKAQAALETREDAPARAIVQHIWRFLEATEARREPKEQEQTPQMHSVS